MFYSSPCATRHGMYTTHTYEHRLQYGESTCKSVVSRVNMILIALRVFAPVYICSAKKMYLIAPTPLEELDKARLSRRLYPFCNSTAWSLQQYKDAVNNGNDYNLVGENIGEGTEGTYIPSFIKPTTPTISQEDKALLQRMWEN